MTNEELARPVTEAEASGLLELITSLGETCGYRPADVLRRLLFERDRLRTDLLDETRRLSNSYLNEADEIEQVLGKALGYPIAYPDVSSLDDGRVCVGEQIPATLAKEAADLIAKLQAAIRRHRDERGDDRCHADDGRLYAVLPEGDTRPEREAAVTLENCARYIECRQTGREYVSPQRRIEELEAEVARLRAGQAH